MLARFATLGLVAAGFALTGDLGWIAAHGMKVINSRTIPVSGVPADPPATAGATPAPNTAARPSAPGSPAPPAPQVGFGRGPQPPARGIEEARLATLRAGDRIVVWLEEARSGRPGGCLAFDVIDPVAGEALVVEVTACSATGSIRTAGPPRRVALEATGTGLTGAAIRRGAPLVMRSAGLAHAGAEMAGTVTAVIVMPGRE